MRVDSCNHKHGDNIPALMGWVCGQCFKVLGNRPKKYGTAGCSRGPRQEIVWQADVLKSAQGTTLSTFVTAVARRFERRGGVDKETAFLMALEAVAGIGEQFGSPDCDWSRMSAIDVADEEMTYWDDVGGGNK